VTKSHRLSFCIYWLAVAASAAVIGVDFSAEANIAGNTTPVFTNAVADEAPPVTAVLAEAAPGEVDLTLAAEQVGLASWYGADFQGKPTASGQIFDEEKLTAAHRTLPLRSRVRVTNLENGRSVEVRINDRGPYVQGRVLDLSTRAAKALGMQKEGLALVRIELLPTELASAAN
jgi:rare lipoprotein A (RlpA)-like double-psi beta-barrel protein